MTVIVDGKRLRFPSCVRSLFVIAARQNPDLFSDHETFLPIFLRIASLSKTFHSFIGGQFIEACILATLCSVGMLLLRMPYAVMIGIMVGFINIIPMVGAYIGGVVGFLMVLTVSPVQAVIFLVYLVVLQQIESNLIYPKVVGNSVGLPGIYVMISVIVLGSLAGIPGMLLGIPSVASLYKLLRRYITYKEQTA